jgi:hypothetical protein
LREVKRPTLFETPYVLPLLRLFELGDTGWLKALKVSEYALRGCLKNIMRLSRRKGARHEPHPRLFALPNVRRAPGGEVPLDPTDRVLY